MSSVLNVFGLGYNEAKLKPHLKMASQRIKIVANKKSTALKIQKREIAKLLEDGKEEKARIKVEGVIRDDFTIEALEILELLCDLVHERIRYISSSATCPVDIKEAVSTLIWSADKIDIAELITIKSQFDWKFGSIFVKSALDNLDPIGNESVVNERIVNKLAVTPPSSFLVIGYLKEIAKEYNLAWIPTEVGVPQESSIMPGPSGFSVPMAPGSGLRAVYQKQPVMTQQEIRSQIEELTMQTQDLQAQLTQTLPSNPLPYEECPVPIATLVNEEEKTAKTDVNPVEEHSGPSFDDLEKRFAALRRP